MTPEEIAAIIEDHKYPTLHAGDTGINVITLQIWLGMLGFYPGPVSGLLDAATAQAVAAFRADQSARGTPLAAPPDAVLLRDTWEAMDNLLRQRLPPDPTAFDRLPFPRRSSYDSEAKYHKALYEGLRVFGFPVAPAAQPLRLPLVINDSGVAILHGIPPGSYTLELGDTAIAGHSSVDLHLDNADGTPFSGQISLVRGGAAQSATVAGGHVLVNGLEPGDYQVVVDRVDTANQIIDNTGSLEIRLFDANYQPLRGTATLVGETGDPASLQQAVRLFKALSRKLTRGLEAGDRQRLDTNILSGDFAATAHRHHLLIWENFEWTWGRFHGAPWIGVMFHPPDRGEVGLAQEELNWGKRDVIAMLYEWGNAYLQSAQDKADLEVRLQRPVAIRYIARPLGGSMDGRPDFSQAGTSVSLHLPRISERPIDGITTGQTYGGINYDSPDYSALHLERQLSVFASLCTISVALCPDSVLVRKLPRSLSEIVVSDLNPKSRLINAQVSETQVSRMSSAKTDELIRLAARTYDEERAKQLRQQIIREYVHRNADQGAVRAWIAELPESDRAYAEVMLRATAVYWARPYGANIMKEWYELDRLELNTSGILSMPYAPVENVLASHPRTLSNYTFYHTTVRIVSGNVKPDKSQASAISSSMITEQHYPDTVDEKHKVDLDSNYNERLVWFGPAFPFKVLQARIFTAWDELGDNSLHAYNDLRWYGSMIRIKVLADKPYAETHTLKLAHFTAIHRAIYEQGASGETEEKKVPFDAGTFLGMTKRRIGYMSGPHLHISSEVEAYQRDKIYTLWTGKEPPR
jgi:hypothetical protein